MSVRVGCWVWGGRHLLGRLPWGLRIVLGWRKRGMLCKRF
nr:MAG TPA: hypothetical protein [Caudoviricetes sp.]